MLINLSKEIPNNPLSDFPYWNAPDGKNLNAIACLEWLLAYLKLMDKELPCSENAECIWLIDRALKLQNHRVKQRKQQGVLGTHSSHTSVPLENYQDIA